MDMLNKQKFGSFVAQLRKKKGLTQKDLAEKLQAVARFLQEPQRYSPFCLFRSLAAGCQRSISES